jgi:uncharacterized membrane protein YphA (DoxX/SURF4 family)
VGGFGQLARLFLADPATLAARIVVGVILVAAGVHKVLHPLVAATAAVNFRVIRRPRRSAGLVLGAVEAVAGLAMLAPERVLAVGGGVAAIGLCAGYAVVIARALAAGETFECNCLPGFSGAVSPLGLVRAVVMLAAAALGVVGAARGVFVSGAALAPALGLAIAAFFLPLAAVAATTAWRAYRKLVGTVDWEMVLDARRHDGEVW